MSVSKVRVAMIGAGMMANRVHYPSLASFEDVEIAAICDLNPTSLKNTADKYGISARYSDYRKMVEETAPDAVYAIGPPHTMYDIWVWCLKNKLNLFIEKPLGVTNHQAKILQFLAESNGCITQVGFQRRSCPLLVELHRRCTERGPIVHVVVEFYKNDFEPMLAASGHMMDDCVHAIDTVRYLCGGEVVGLESTTKRIGTPDINMILGVLQFDSGSTGVIMNSWTSGRRVFRAQMHGRGMCAEVDPELKGTIYADGDTVGNTFLTQDIAGSDEFHVYGGFSAKNRQFIDAVRTQTQPPSNFSDAVKTMDVADKILAQDILRR